MVQDYDVVVIGSGFGGAVAALRFAEAGFRVAVLERGGWVSREPQHLGPSSLLWKPERGWLGRHDIRARGDVVPWLAAAVGGGSHIYGGALARPAGRLRGLPGVDPEKMDRYFRLVEGMLRPVPYPIYPPYSLPSSGLFPNAKEVQLGISFAPPGIQPGTLFTNEHGAQQRHWDPREQSLLGGDVGAKNTLDLNYLHRAMRLGARVFPYTEARHISRRLDGTLVVATREPGTREDAIHWRARQVVVACGAIGSTELLLRSQEENLQGLSPALGTRYTTNGDWLALMLPAWERAALSWLGAGLSLSLAAAGSWWALPALALYWASLSGKRAEPDAGTTVGGDYRRFIGPDGEIIIESGRYPTPGRLLLSSLVRHWRPERYADVRKWSRWLEAIPPLGALARSWPFPLLVMGRDHAMGSIGLDSDGKPRVAIDLDRNRSYYRAVRDGTRTVAQEADALWLPNIPRWLLGKPEITHNLGGCPMGTRWEDGVVDGYGRVFGVPGLAVLDGSILPCSIGPNPSLTIAALAERGVARIASDLKEGR